MSGSVPAPALLVEVVVGGALAGWGIRLLLAAVPRGMRMRPGPPETAAATLSALAVLLAWDSVRLGPLLLVGLLAVALVPVDVAHHRLPDIVTLPAIGCAALLVAGVTVTRTGVGSLLTAAICAAGGWLVFAGLATLSPRSMGRGDVKLVPTLGLLTGYVSAATALVALVIAFVTGALVAVAGLLFGGLGLKSAIPFGPCLLAGAWLALAFPGVAQLLEP